MTLEEYHNRHYYELLGLLIEVGRSEARGAARAMLEDVIRAKLKSRVDMMYYEDRVDALKNVDAKILHPQEQVPRPKPAEPAKPPAPVPFPPSKPKEAAK